MLIAEIRRKLGDLDDLDLEGSDPKEALQAFLSSRKEDILTADVFGTLKYLPRDPYWKHVLHGVQTNNPHSTAFGRCLAEQSFGESDFEFSFWPWYRTPAGIDGQRMEPDVEIVSDRMRLFVEAKLHSDFGDLQIVRQLLIGLAASDPSREFFLLLVTKGFRVPRIRFGSERLLIAEYLHRVAGTLSISAEQREQLVAASERVLWINWRTIGRLLDQCHRELPSDRRNRTHDDLLTDLRQLLTLRSLAPLRGVPKSLPDVGRGRPVIARFLEGPQTHQRHRFCVATAVARFVESTVSYRAPLLLRSDRE